ncbi:MAG: hypothetical protein QOD72_2343 [Acidimicrobiaceae bacterium]|nr:hypothetical protein [Acidimicrobiaceae bacterium]
MVARITPADTLAGEQEGFASRSTRPVRVPAPDILVKPGSSGAREAELLTRASVCTGSLVLASAGLLDGRRASTHCLVVDDLAALGAIATGERVVHDGKYLTAAGVSASIDMALTLAAIVADECRARAIELGVEYGRQRWIRRLMVRGGEHLRRWGFVGVGESRRCRLLD